MDANPHSSQRGPFADRGNSVPQATGYYFLTAHSPPNFKVGTSDCFARPAPCKSRAQGLLSSSVSLHCTRVTDTWCAQLVAQVGRPLPPRQRSQGLFAGAASSAEVKAVCAASLRSQVKLCRAKSSKTKKVHLHLFFTLKSSSWIILSCH